MPITGEVIFGRQAKCKRLDKVRLLFLLLLMTFDVIEAMTFHN